MQFQSDSGRDTRKLRRIVIACFAVIPLICCGGLVLFSRRWLDIWDSSADLDHQVAEAQRRGFPLEAKDLAQVPAVLDSENAYPVFTQLMKKYPRNLDIKHLVSRYQLKKGSHLPDTVENLIKDSRVVISKSGFDPHRDYDQMLFLEYPEFDFGHELAAALAKHAEQEAINGRFAWACEDLKLVAHLAELLGSERILLSMLEYCTIDQIFVKACLHVYGYAGEHKVTFEAIRELLRRPVRAPSFLDCFRGEFYHPVSLTRNRAQFGDASTAGNRAIDPKTLKRSGVPSGFVERGVLAAYIKHEVKIYDIYKAAPNLVVGAKQATKYIESIPPSVTKVGVEFLIDSYDHACIRLECQRHSHELAIDALSLAESKMEASAIERATSIADPSGTHAIYRPTSKGFLLYFVGYNGLDDGGPKNNSNRKNSDDFGFEYPFVQRQ